MYKRGNIHLAKLYPKRGDEVGKIRPVLILQTDSLNEIHHSTVIVLPLTTSIVDNSYPLRYRIQKRDKLVETSEILCDQIRSIDVNRLHTNIITSLTKEEMILIEDQVQIILGFV